MGSEARLSVAVAAVLACKYTGGLDKTWGVGGGGWLKCAMAGLTVA